MATPVHRLACVVEVAAMATGQFYFGPFAQGEVIEGFSMNSANAMTVFVGVAAFRSRPGPGIGGWLGGLAFTGNETVSGQSFPSVPISFGAIGLQWVPLAFVGGRDGYHFLGFAVEGLAGGGFSGSLFLELRATSAGLARFGRSARESGKGFRRKQRRNLEVFNGEKAG